MNIMDFLKIKNNFLEKSSIHSLMLKRNLQFTNNYKKKFNQVTSNSPFRQNILPLIHKFNSLNSTKQFSKNKKFIQQHFFFFFISCSSSFNFIFIVLFVSLT